MTWEVLQGDVTDVLPAFPENYFHGMLTDPPYGLSFMGREWDQSVPGVDVWRGALRVLKPGAYALVFGGTRTWHRLAVALEDAGFELRDTMMWLYGSGFPKSHNICKATGSDRWQGYGTALKPAWEPVLLVRKPLVGTVAANALQHGVGGLNIDGTRVEWANPSERDEVNARVAPNSRHAPENSNGSTGWGSGRVRAQADLTHASGRWPANVIHDGSNGVTDHMPIMAPQGSPKKRDSLGKMYGGGAKDSTFFGDTGSVARFFYAAKASKSEREAGLKGNGDRANRHPTVKPLALTEYLARLILPPENYARVLVPFSGSGSEMIGALKAGWGQAVGIEAEAEYVSIAEKRIAHWTRQPTMFTGKAE